MAGSFVRRSSVLDSVSRFKRRWQRSMAVELTLIALFIAFATCEILYSLNANAS